MVVSITGDRPAVAARDVESVMYASFDLLPGDFTIHAHCPEDFLLIFATRELMDRLSGDHFINGPGFTLALRPWNKLAHAQLGSLDCSVELELRGIPAQAWHLSTAEHLLGTSCWIERLHPNTRSRADLATFCLTARTCDPAS
uniref:DUF4283 domain-containing protein n=1 Tax=Aegilops tauschii subsp. strangulata TaxID=200361 RepID=A0A453JTS6_AEGTS